jgi:hypothetical protein
VSVARLQVRFVPVSVQRGGQEHRYGLVDWLDYDASISSGSPARPTPPSMPPSWKQRRRKRDRQRQRWRDDLAANFGLRAVPEWGCR